MNGTEQRARHTAVSALEARVAQLEEDQEAQRRRLSAFLEVSKGQVAIATEILRERSFWRRLRWLVVGR